MSKSKGGSFRSAVSGQFVTPRQARASPSTTLFETKGAGSAGGTFRSAKTGKFVTTSYGQTHPKTTIKDN